MLLLRVVSVVLFVVAQRRRGAVRVGAATAPLAARSAERRAHTTQARSEAGTASNWLENGLLFGLVLMIQRHGFFMRFATLFWL